MTGAMSEPLTREQIIEQAADAMDVERVTIGSGFYALDVPYGTCLTLAERAVPVITRAITDRVRALHSQTIRDEPHFYKDEGTLLCWQCRKPAPCPTRCALDAIDAEMGVQR